MKIQTFSIVVGTKACNGRCLFCISGQTGYDLLNEKNEELNIRNFKKACTFAKDSGVSTVILTGKGEPTLYPNDITNVLFHMNNYKFPFIELQTNGILLAEKWQEYKEYLKTWYNYGLTTVIISVVHYDAEKNHQIYTPYKESYYDLPELIRNLHSLGLSVRLSCVGLNGFIDSSEEIENFIKFAKENNVEQISYCAVAVANHSKDESIRVWTEKHQLTQNQISEINTYINKNGIELMKLVHGATVYDIDGQNFCYTNCLTIDPNEEEIRQLIFFPNGKLYYDWQYKGAILL